MKWYDEFSRLGFGFLFGMVLAGIVAVLAMIDYIFSY
jgi:hypothetical protein